MYLFHLSVFQSCILRVRPIARAHLEIILLRAFLSVEAEQLELLETLLSDIPVSTNTKCAAPVIGKKLNKWVN